MMTNTHMLIAATALSRPHHKVLALAAVWLGGFFPDLPLVVVVVVGRLTSTANLWRQPDGLYWVDPWRFFDTIANSLPLFAALMLIGYLAMKFAGPRLAAVGFLLLLFAAGAFLGAVTDLPVHTDDAHIHFWPFTDWRFISPVSYYQPQHYGRIVGGFEIVAGLAMSVYLFRTFQQQAIRILVVLMALPYILEIGVILFFRPRGLG